MSADPDLLIADWNRFLRWTDAAMQHLEQPRPVAELEHLSMRDPLPHWSRHTPPRVSPGPARTGQHYTERADMRAPKSPKIGSARVSKYRSARTYGSEVITVGDRC